MKDVRCVCSFIAAFLLLSFDTIIINDTFSSSRNQNNTEKEGENGG